MTDHTITALAIRSSLALALIVALGSVVRADRPVTPPASLCGL
ncbi:MAG TPA: hypothetical protein VK862_12165 [Afifellaceae bacterium]|nr:hypothetical protein [Afifellaceae bacterium]